MAQSRPLVPGRARRLRGRVALSAFCLVVLWFATVAGGAGASPTQPDRGSTTPETISFGGGEYTYLVHTPAPRPVREPLPLVVVVHGCQTTAEQQMRSSLMNDLAERERFVVLYADVDELGRLLPGPANQCWKFPYPPAWTRGGSDAGAIAAMTRAVMAEHTIDPERVFIMGMSAGGLMVSIEAAAYPELYAAAGVIAAAGYADFACLATGTGLPVEASAQLAFAQMGPRARVVPRIVMGGTADDAFPPACVEKALEQGLRTNNLVLSGSQSEPIPLQPATVEDGQVPGGYSYTVSSFLDPDGCLVGEQWIIDDLAHSWPGGTTNPDDQYNNDTNAPDAGETFWAFFEQFTLSSTDMQCATVTNLEGAGPPTPRPPTPAPAAQESAGVAAIGSDDGGLPATGPSHVGPVLAVAAATVGVVGGSAARRA